MRHMETMRMISKKVYASKLSQTEDLVEAEMIKQLKEWKSKHALKIFGYRKYDDVPVRGGV